MIPEILLVKCDNGNLCTYGILHILFALININTVSVPPARPERGQDFTRWQEGREEQIAHHTSVDTGSVDDADVGGSVADLHL
jgi:hypothetical protein